MDSGLKRKGSEELSAPDKRQKQKKQWRVPRRNDNNSSGESRSIQPGDSGVWATCDKGRERKCVGELQDLFGEYVEVMYGDSINSINKSKSDENDAAGDIESKIQEEINGLQEAKRAALFTPVQVDVQCVIFMKTQPPIEPVALVKRICEDASKAQAKKRTRFVKRLSPMTLMGRASEQGLDNVARTVLAPYFHTEPFTPRKFAIRPSLRNHNVLSRDSIIQQVAKIIGPGHVVNLKDYDLLVVIEVYKNVCGISVLDKSFEQMKRYNLAEIFNPSAKAEIT